MLNRIAWGMSGWSRRVISALGVLSVAFHLGLASIHHHDSGLFHGPAGTIERLQDSADPPNDANDAESCVICQLLSIFKGAPPDFFWPGQPVALPLALVVPLADTAPTRPWGVIAQPRGPPSARL